MQNHQASAPHVALLTTTQEHQQLISDLLCENGLEVTLLDHQSPALLKDVHQSHANVLLVDIAEDTQGSTNIIDTLLDDESLPILFNDSSPTGAPTDKVWAKQLSRKLVQLAEQQIAREHAADDTQQTPEQSELLAPALDMNSATRNVWVLAASLGGPEAVQEFLAAVNPDLPVAFLLAQHIGASHTGSLAAQLNKATSFDVFPASSKHTIKHHQVLVIPAGKQITIKDDGRLELETALPGAVNSPSIEQTLNCVAAHYANTSGIIFFSGMGNDGVKASKQLAEKGGQVWAQSADSCVVSGLPETARKSGAVTVTGTPGELARQLNQMFGL